MPDPVEMLAPDAKDKLPAEERVTVWEGLLTAPWRIRSATVVERVRFALPLTAPLSVNAPLPVCDSEVVPVQVIGALNVAVVPRVMFVPLSEIVPAEIVNMPVDVGPMVEPAIEKLEVAVND